MEGVSFMAEYRWLGHNCFRIKAREAVVLTDPVDRITGYAMQKQTADIVTISHEHQGHINLNAVKPEFQVVRGPGEYEIHEVFITGIRTYHDKEKGATRGYNTIYLIEMEGIITCHLGDLGHPLSEEQAEAISDCDVLLIPAGGNDLLTPDQAADLIAQVEPKIVIPMQYATANGDANLGGIEPFAKRLGAESIEKLDKFVIRHNELPDTMRLVVLEPESDAARR
jgi:L-ascorbate metabolism protein UlaG (beta-lactamase superfamily)